MGKTNMRYLKLPFITIYFYGRQVDVRDHTIYPQNLRFRLCYFNWRKKYADLPRFSLVRFSRG